MPMPEWRAPVWHLPARCAAGDMNALFQYEGVWHLMQQWGDGRHGHTSVGHAVSSDLLQWERVADALVGASKHEQCFDGSASILNVNGSLTPVLMVDGGCGRKAPGSVACMESSGNGSQGGVVGFPTSISDPNLTSWRTVGPTLFLGCDTSAGPGPIFRSTDGELSLVAIHRAAEGRFVATDASLTRWRMADPSFVKRRGGGGGLWHTLPPNVPNSTGTRWPTHMIQSNSDSSMATDGRPTFTLGVYTGGRFRNATAPMPVDSGGSVAYGMLSTEGGTGRGGTRGDGRTLHISWLRDDATPLPPVCDTGGMLTSIRDLRFDPRIGRLVELPIAEYVSLRGKMLARRATTILRAHAPPTVLADLGTNNTSSFDAEMVFALPTASTATLGIELGFRCSTASECTDGARVNLSIGPSFAHGSGTRRNGSMVVTTPIETQHAPFVLLPAEVDADTIPVRVMSDVRSLEIFVARGRAVFSGVVVSDAAKLVAASTGGGDAVLARAGVWELRPVRRPVNRG